jgi:esterase/lipase
MDNINIDTDNIDNIDKYYSTVDKNVINNLCTDNNIKNLIHLSAKTDINPFNKCKKKWNLKSKNKLLKECENIKKKEFKEIYSRLNNLSKLGNNNIDDLKNIYKKSENKLDTLHKLINCINNINLSSQD